MRLVVTVDTEEDQWGQFDLPTYTTANARRLPEFQALCDEWAVCPTYLVSYEMARQEESAAILAGLAARKDVEIGAHCHPWNTPPLERSSGGVSMLCNLSPELQLAKLETLTTLIEKQFDRRPVSFRAGRWGLNKALARNLNRLQYHIDTSVTPFFSWRRQSGPDYSRAYPEQFWLDLGPDPEQRLMEVPATVGFLQNDSDRASAILNAIEQSVLLRSLRAHGILNRLGLLNRIWICPEMTGLRDMIAMTRRLKARGASVINLMFHSVTLEPGLSPFVRSPGEAAAFRRRLRQYFEYCRGEAMESVPLRDLYHSAAPLPVGMI